MALGSPAVPVASRARPVPASAVTPGGPERRTRRRSAERGARGGGGLAARGGPPSASRSSLEHERRGPVGPADERGGEGADAEDAGDQAGGDRAREAQIAQGELAEVLDWRRVVLRSVMSESLCKDDSAVSRTRIRGFSGNCQYLDEGTTRPGFRNFWNPQETCFQRRKVSCEGRIRGDLFAAGVPAEPHRGRVRPRSRDEPSRPSAGSTTGEDPMTEPDTPLPSRPHVRAPSRCSGGCSSRARGPTARCTGRRAGSGSTRATARSPRSSSYGTVQRRGDARSRDLRARRPAGRASSSRPVLAALRLGVFQLAFLDGVAAHAAVGESVELAKATSPRRRRTGQRRAAPRGARGARAGRGAARMRTPARGRAAPLLSRVDRRAVVRRARAGRGARADGGRQPAGRAGAARQRAAHHRRGAGRRAARRQSRPAEALPEGLVLEAPFDAFALAAVGAAALFMPQSRAAMAVVARARPAPGRARARPVRRARAARRPTWRR